MSETWLSWCEKIPGPAWKQGYFGIPNRPLSLIEGDVKHSAEGGWAALLNEINHPTRQSSWTFAVRKDGHVVQHYPLESVTWHCGKPGDLHTETELIGNAALVGIEHEGRAGEPLTSKQIESTVRISRDLRALTFAGANPPELAVNLWEHNWISNVTSCPSNRVPWDVILEQLEEEDMALDADAKRYIDERFREIKFLLGKSHWFDGDFATDENATLAGWINGKLNEGTPINVTLSDADLKKVGEFAAPIVAAAILAKTFEIKVK